MGMYVNHSTKYKCKTSSTNSEREQAYFVVGKTRKKSFMENKIQIYNPKMRCLLAAAGKIQRRHEGE